MICDVIAFPKTESGAYPGTGCSMAITAAAAQGSRNRRQTRAAKVRRGRHLDLGAVGIFRRENRTRAVSVGAWAKAGAVDMPFELAPRDQAGEIVYARAGARDGSVGRRDRPWGRDGAMAAVFTRACTPCSAARCPARPGCRRWCWYAGTGAVLSHETAAEVERLLDKPAPLIHLTVRPPGGWLRRKT